MAIKETVEESKLTIELAVSATQTAFPDGQDSPAYGSKQVQTDCNEFKSSN